MVTSHFPSLITITGLFISISLVSSFDPMPSKDFCVADLKNKIGRMSASGPGLPCKDRSTVKADDFFHGGLHVPGDTNNSYNAAAFTVVNVVNTPGLNTMGFSMARLDLGPGGFFPPHFHQRASELHIVLEGCLGVGFVAPGSSNYTMYGKNLTEGDVFVVPVGLVHYQINCGNEKTSSYAVLNSQNPGLNYLTRAVFGSNPAMDRDYLGHAYQLDDNIIESLLTKDWV